jgi:small-conductance mechanosensitive channel
MTAKTSTSMRARVIVAASLFVLFVLSIIFAWSTRDAMSHLGFLKGQQASVVDITPWQTAQSLAALAVTAEEEQFAHEAERLADHEVDQAFSSALRQAGTPLHPKTPAAIALAKRVDELQSAIKVDQQHVQDLSTAGVVATSDNPDSDLDIAKAQLGLDSDELADAQQDLARAEGDQRVKINQALAAHQAVMAKLNAQQAQRSQADIATVHSYGSVARRVKAYFDQLSRLNLLEQASQQAQADAKNLAGEHDAIEGKALPAGGSDSSSRLAALKSRSARSQLLSIYDDRIQTEQQLASVYGKWAAQVGVQHRIVLHLLLVSGAMIALVLLLLLLADSLLNHLLERPGLDWRRLQTLKSIFKVGIQLAGLLVILLMVFGVPSQTPAIIGLATAGLTVVLQDFIVAFFGWFVLMGKNGLSVGDWVEINGTGGEVAEIGLFRTALFETGNWTDNGHPTGRRVTFTNSFAIRGQYFNFSTSGQWLWDEITLSIPSSEDTYLMVEAIRFAVMQETEAEAKLAEEEWKRVTRESLGQFSAVPAVDLRPSAGGIDVVVRYVTKAKDRFELRNRIYQRLLHVMNKAPRAELGSTPTPGSTR